MLFGLVLLAIGIIALLMNLGILSGSMWSYIWPALLIIVGLSFIWGRFSGRGRRWSWRWCCPEDDEEKR